MTSVECHDPVACPVPLPGTSLDASHLRAYRLPQGRHFYRVYPLKFGCDSFNCGPANTRFAPVSDGAKPVPSMYGGTDETVVLLETVFHEIHHLTSPRLVIERLVRPKGLAHLQCPQDLQLVDLRNPALEALGIAREQLVSTTEAHYPCTRDWAVWLHGLRVEGRRPAGIIWHSRQAELHPTSPPREVFVLFGDRSPTAAGSYPLVGPGVRNLLEGPGRDLIEELAEELDAVIVP